MTAAPDAIGPLAGTLSSLEHKFPTTQGSVLGFGVAVEVLGPT